MHNIEKSAIDDSQTYLVHELRHSEGLSECYCRHEQLQLCQEQRYLDLIMKMDISGIVLLGGDEPDHTIAW